jgi:hypothetical protein
MKTGFAAVLLAGTLAAQEIPPSAPRPASQQREVVPPIVSGTLILAEGGVLEVKRATGSAVRCGFDTHTWIEQDRKRLSLTALEPGVPVEILTDLRAGRCYTRTVRIVPAGTPLNARRPMTPVRSIIENIYPRGNLTFGGVVIRRSPTVLVVRTRTEPEKIVRLREDTRFLDSGTPATSADVAVNTRVFVRAGKNFENDIEAYQVIWGEIAGPKSSITQ